MSHCLQRDIISEILCRHVTLVMKAEFKDRYTLTHEYSILK